MVDKIVNINEHINKKDLEIILEVNRKAIEIETEVADQNEEIICLLNKSKIKIEEFDKKLEEHNKKMDKLIDLQESTNKDIFKIKVLFVTGLFSLIIQIIQIFNK
jgi:hypothetical protein